MLPERLKELRTGAKMSQRELAEKLYMSQQAVAKWETGASTPNPELLVKISKIFNVTVDSLLGDTIIARIEDTNRGFCVLDENGEAFYPFDYKKKAAIPKDDGPAEEDARLLNLLRNSDPDLKKAMIEFLEKAQK